MGETQRRPLGFPYFRTGQTGGTIRRPGPLAVVIAGLGFSVFALATALWGSPTMGATSENPGGVVLRVEPGSFAWQMGIRAGQVVVSLESSDSPDGGAITTGAPDSQIRSSSAAVEDAVRATLPAAMAATAFGLLAILAIAWHSRRAEALASLAVVLAALPLSIGSEAPISTVARLAAVAFPTLWLAKHSPLLYWRTVIGGAAVAIAVAWFVAWAAVPSVFDALETARAGAVAVSGGLVIGLQFDRRAIAERLRMAGGLRTLDVAILATAGALAVGLHSVVGAPPILTAGILGLGLLLYPRWRRKFAVAIDRMLVADLRERLTLAASEAERGRLARDLHDVPLQELAGVIRRLDLVPDARAENTALRQIADKLRSIATELRPPILDDLGLAPALDALVAHAAGEADPFEVGVAVRDETGSGQNGRPPPEVEIAIYRIVQEALANAIRHSGGKRAKVSGTVAVGRIVLTVSDDGMGLADTSLERGTRSGRLGVASMRNRAESVGAALAFEPSAEGGLAVKVSWTQ